MQTNLGLRNFVFSTAFIMFAFASYILVFTRVTQPTLENTKDDDWRSPPKNRLVLVGQQLNTELFQEQLQACLSP